MGEVDFREAGGGAFVFERGAVGVDFGGDAGLVPSELDADESGHALGRGRGGGPIEQPSPRAASEHVVQGGGHLVADGVDGLGPAVGQSGDEGGGEIGIGVGEGEDRGGLAAVPTGEVLVVRFGAGSTHKPEVLGATRGPTADRLQHCVGGVLGHLAVGGELAAGHGHEPGLRGRDLVPTRQVRGLLADGPAGDERSEPGPGADHVVDGERLGHRHVHRVEEVLHVLGCALRIVDRAVVVRVRGPDVGEVAPRHHEDRPLVLRDRNDGRDVVAHLLPGNRDVDALGGADGMGVGALVHLAHVVGEDAGRVHDHSGGDVEGPAVGLDGGPFDPTGGTLA